MDDIMETYVKTIMATQPVVSMDRSMDSAITYHRTGGPLPHSIFGDCRFQVPASHFSKQNNTKMYFADLYCIQGPHYVTLVITKENSEADMFCKRRLIELNIHANSVLYYDELLDEVYTTKCINVEVFYTEDIDLNLWIKRYGCTYMNNIEMKGSGSTLGGLQINDKCNICNLDD